jgi:hypothetical protein
MFECPDGRLVWSFSFDPTQTNPWLFALDERPYSSWILVGERGRASAWTDYAVAADGGIFELRKQKHAAFTIEDLHPLANFVGMCDKCGSCLKAT